MYFINFTVPLSNSRILSRCLLRIRMKRSWINRWKWDTMRNGVTGAEGCQVFVMLSNETSLFFLFEFSGTSLIGRKSWNAETRISELAQTVEARTTTFKKEHRFSTRRQFLFLFLFFFPLLSFFLSFFLSFVVFGFNWSENRATMSKCSSCVWWGLNDAQTVARTTLKKSVASIEAKKT